MRMNHLNYKPNTLSWKNRRIKINIQKKLRNLICINTVFLIFMIRIFDLKVFNQKLIFKLRTI